MQSRKGINWRNASRPRRKFLVLMATAAISAALLGLAAHANHSLALKGDGTGGAGLYQAAGPGQGAGSP